MSKVTFFDNGSFVFNECPSCGGRYSLLTKDIATACTPVWCITKKMNPEKDAQKVLEKEGRLLMKRVIKNG